MFQIFVVVLAVQTGNVNSNALEPIYDDLISCQIEAENMPFGLSENGKASKAHVCFEVPKR